MYCPETKETTALGAAYLAGLAVGFWASKEDIGQHWKIRASWTPKMKNENSHELYEGWRRAVQACKEF